MSEFILSQILASISFAFGIASYQWKSRKVVLLFWFACALLNGIHFIILDRPGAAALICISSIRFLVAAFTTNKKAMYFFLLFALLGFLFTFEHYIAFLGLFSSLLSTYGSFQNKDEKMRILFMIGGLGWVIHNTIAGTPIAALMEASFLLSNVIGYWRFYRLKQGNNCSP